MMTKKCWLCSLFSLSTIPIMIEGWLVTYILLYLFGIFTIQPYLAFPSLATISVFLPIYYTLSKQPWKIKTLHMLVTIPLSSVTWYLYRDDPNISLVGFGTIFVISMYLWLSFIAYAAQKCSKQN